MQNIGFSELPVEVVKKLKPLPSEEPKIVFFRYYLTENIYRGRNLELW